MLLDQPPNDARASDAPHRARWTLAIAIPAAIAATAVVTARIPAIRRSEFGMADPRVEQTVLLTVAAWFCALAALHFLGRTFRSRHVPPGLALVHTICVSAIALSAVEGQPIHCAQSNPIALLFLAAPLLAGRSWLSVAFASLIASVAYLGLPAIEKLLGVPSEHASPDVVASALFTLAVIAIGIQSLRGRGASSSDDAAAPNSYPLAIASLVSLVHLGLIEPRLLPAGLLPWYVGVRLWKSSSALVCMATFLFLSAVSVLLLLGSLATSAGAPLVADTLLDRIAVEAGRRFPVRWIEMAATVSTALGLFIAVECLLWWMTGRRQPQPTAEVTTRTAAHRTGPVPE